MQRAQTSIYMVFFLLSISRSAMHFDNSENVKASIPLTFGFNSIKLQFYCIHLLSIKVAPSVVRFRRDTRLSSALMELGMQWISSFSFMWLSSDAFYRWILSVDFNHEILYANKLFDIVGALFFYQDDGE